MLDISLLIVVQQENISTVERSWKNPLIALKEAIHYSFIKFFNYCFFLLVRFLCALHIESRKNDQYVIDAGLMGFQFLKPTGCITNPFRILSLCFGVIGQTPGLTWSKILLKWLLASGFGGLVVSMLASGNQDRRLAPGRSRPIFRPKKSSSCLPSERK
jgi:hypothetical protein